MRRPTLYFITLAVMLSGCTGLKYVPKEERLYTGATVKIAPEKKIKSEGKARSQVKAVIKPAPNTQFLHMRPQLWLYYVIGSPKKEKGIRNWIKTKMGQPPVYLSQVDPSLVSKGIDAKLYNTGYFDSYNQYTIKDINGKTAAIDYTLFLNEPYTIETITYPNDTSALSKAIGATAMKSLLKKGENYSLDALVGERERIDNHLKNHGFYYFNPDYILFKMDTSANKHTLRLHVTLKKDIPEKSKRIYRIAEVNVYPDYKADKEDTLSAKKEVIDTVNYFNGTGYIRPTTVLHSVFLKNNSLYDRKKHNLTLNHLNGLGVFKFVNIRITDKDSLSRGLLLANIFLTPLPKRSMSMEVQGVSKSNNFVGPGINFSLRNRNAFKGAELLIYNLRTSFETQINGVYKGQFTYEVNPRVELYVPRFITPFNIKENGLYVPRTKFTFDYNYLSRVGYFDMNSFKYTFGYKWKQTRTIDHDLSLLDITYFKLYNPTPAFNGLINSNILLKRRFEQQFIAGISYAYTYNQQVIQQKKNQVYFNGNVELAGNTLSLLHKLTSKEPATPDNPAKILGINFAQFARISMDVRDFIHTGQSMLVTRFFAGWGLPYGNSSTMPYSRQFFSGGAYSVRGFQAYSLGPGSYAPPDSLKNIFFLQQGGEIKLETNIEYRFPIAGFFKGAIFSDAGNTWLNRNNTQIPNGDFNVNRFMKEIAVGMGTGIRIDLNYFVLRFDLGIPVRKPWLPENERWVLSKIRPSDTSWRRENMVFNIAFGYPF